MITELNRFDILTASPSYLHNKGMKPIEANPPVDFGLKGLDNLREAFTVDSWKAFGL